MNSKRRRRIGAEPGRQAAPHAYRMGQVKAPLPAAPTPHDSPHLLWLKQQLWARRTKG